MTVITLAKGHAGLISLDQATVGVGDPVCVAAEIGEDMFGRSSSWHHQIRPANRRSVVARLISRPEAA
jgi:hypothetical protein